MGFWDDFGRAYKAKRSGKNFLEHTADEANRKKQEGKQINVTLDQLRLFLKTMIEGAENIDKFRNVLLTSGVIFFVQRAPVDLSLLQQHHIQVLQQYAQELVEARLAHAGEQPTEDHRRAKSQNIDEGTRGHGNRRRWSSQQ